LAAQLVEQPGRYPRRIAARDEPALDRLQGTSGVTLGQRDQQLVQEGAVVLNDSGCHHLVEGRESISRRTASAANGGLHGRVRQLELGVSRHVRQKQRQHLGIEQTELVVLGPAANRGKDLLGVGRREYEHDMVRGFFQCLQQGVRRSR
jgi:hypothetical protein